MTDGRVQVDFKQRSACLCGAHARLHGDGAAGQDGPSSCYLTVVISCRQDFAAAPVSLKQVCGVLKTGSKRENPLTEKRGAHLEPNCQLWVTEPEVLNEVDEVFEKYKGEQDAAQRKRLQIQLQRALIISQELGDEKIHVVTQMTELVENRSRQMDSHSLCLQEPSEAERLTTERRSSIQESPAPERTSTRRPRRQRNSESRDSSHQSANGSLDDPVEELSLPPPREKKSKSAKKKKRKAKQERDASPVDFAIDPNEPTYCLCEQVSYGEMIGCDNDQCPIEWFHFSCVGLTYKPKGKWYCPKCRGDNEKTMDKSLDKNRKDRRSR